MAQAIFFGAIGTLAETSELQRQAFNEAFQEAGLDWQWSAPEYVEMLGKSGGRDRIARYAEARDVEVDAGHLHTRKSEIYQASLARGVAARSGVVDVIEAALGMSIPLAFVTATDRANVDAIFGALPDTIHEGIFKFVGDRTLVENGKPSSDIYELALERLGLEASEVIAIEDSPPSAEAAMAAGIPTIAFPGLAHTGRTFDGVDARVDRLTPELFGLGAALGDDTLRSAVA